MEEMSGIQVHQSVFPGIYNLASAKGVGFGHVMCRLSYEWSAWLWLPSEDEYQGTFKTRDAAIQAMSVLAP